MEKISVLSVLGNIKQNKMQCQVLSQQWFQEKNGLKLAVLYLRKQGGLVYKDMCQHRWPKKKNDIKGFVKSKAAVRRCSSKEVFLKISQYSQENTCVQQTQLY